jgi:DNA-binding phage protein
MRKKTSSSTSDLANIAGDHPSPVSHDWTFTYVSDRSRLYTPLVTTDLKDYAPGSTAIITASGFSAGSTVTLEVDHAIGAGADGVWGTSDDVLDTNTGEGHEPWSVTDGGAGDLDGQVNGSVTTSWYVNPDDSAGATFLLTAASAGADGVVGTGDDAMATASFTDSVLGVVATGEDVTLDETAGLQNGTATPSPVGDADDNDILVASLPSTFATRLTALGAGTATGAALSGYTGAVGNTGSNAFTITADPGASITDISFVGSTGAPLNGVDSGLDTLDGTSILLYTDTNNNIVVGRAGSATGAIVFAAYIEETGSPVTGGKIWIVEYQPLKHPVMTNADDSLNLLDKVFIGASQDLEFSLANAPSGQNLFLMFTKANPNVIDVGGVLRITDPTIIATGKDPADQSSGANITTGDTINTSQAGGPTTFGTNNQMIVEQEGIRFSFVTGARQNVTIPNLDQNEADLESNVDFTGVFNAKSASFDVVQLQSGKSAIVKVSAFSTAAEPGANFINGYAGDSSIAITNIRVINKSTGQVIENSDGSVNSPSIVISVVGGVATITGVLAGYQIQYTTTADHNRVLIENGAAVDAKGNNHADFDIGGFKLVQASISTTEIGSKIIFDDDGPSISTTGTEPTLTVDETLLANNATQNFAANFTSAFGADGAGTLTYALGVVAGASGLTDTATGEAVNLSLNGTVVEGRTATTNLLVFTASVAANGDVTLDQIRAVVHSNATNPDDSTSLTSDNLVTLTATKTDKDGDSAQATLNIGQNLVFKDDGPSISTTGVEPTLTVDETVLATNTTQSFAANFTSAFGADDAGTLTYALGVVAGASGLTDTATGEAVNLSVNGTVVEGRTATTNLLVFTASVAANGDVTLDQLRAVVHPDATNPDDSKTLTSDNLVTLTATKTDKDGDSAQATLNIGQNLVFKDDGPSISTTGVEPTLTVDETVLATNTTQSFAANFTSAFGADDAGTLTYALGVVAGASGLTDTATGEAVNLSVNGTVVEGRTATTNLLVFTASVAANGDVTLDQLRAVVHPDATNPDDSKTLTSDNLVTLTATKTDKDGDSAQATLNIGQNLVFKDDGPSISTTGVEPTLTVDETVLATNTTQSFAANFTSAFGADDAGTLTYALGVVAGASGLTDTATGEAVNLSVNGTVVEGRTATTNLLVFTASVAANGDVTLDQLRAVVHPDATNPDDSKTLTSDNLVTLTATKTDKDGDSAQATLNIGQNLVFKDDGPSISTTGVEPTLTVDETVLATNTTQSFAANFNSAFGADDAGTLTYALGMVAGASGLTDTATGEVVNLSLNGTVVEGRTATGNLLVFTVSVAANGDVTLDQIRAVVHPDATNPDDSKTLTSDNLVTLTATKTDRDGDSAQATLNIGQNLVFKDDGPSINTTGVEPTLTVDETLLATNATQNFAANFTSAFGADDAGTLTYALGVVAGASGLTDTATGEAVNLSLNGTVVEGRTATTSLLVFTASVAANGDVTLDQIRAVVHPNTSNPDDSKTLTSDNLVTLTATITDKEGDSAQATLNIGQNLVFKDDGPSISTTGVEPTLTVDETVLATNATQSFAANFNSAFGADDAGTLTYALGVVAGASGLTDTASGQAVNLSLNGTVVEGRTATGNLLVFTASVAANGSVTLDQLRAVVHSDASNPDDSKTLAADNLVTLTAIKTDKDGDSAQATLNIGQNLVFKDDGPALAFGNLIGTGSVLAQSGFWNMATGADGLGAAGLDISLVNNQFTLVRPDNTTTTGTGTLHELSPSPDVNGAYQFAGTLTGDFDNNASTANTTVDYTLTAYADGRYALDLVQGFSSTIVLSSADGSLAAGGPDSVRTLLIPQTSNPAIPSTSEEIVFFSAKALASTADILTGIGLGAPDPTEAALQTTPLPSYIDPAAMNVSTSGIGVANNVFQGDNLAAISAADESFVINPESLLTGMKVFIDNSVAGYNTATEDLYYRIYYENGSNSSLIEVNTLTPEAGGQVSFLIQKEGTLLIDAVQLTMGRGDIKIPVIQFIQQSESLASDVQLAFSATLTDKDGDSATSTFDANLFANDPANASFDFTLVGTAGEQDAFNIDLSVNENLYQVSGFDVGPGLRDKLVLNGDPNAVVQSINNTGADSVVTVAETGGQTTTITLVGVDVLNTDVFFGSA